MSCFYCDENNENRQKLMMFVGDLRASKLYLFKDQAHKGRCVVAVNGHYSEISDIPVDMRHDFVDDIADVTAAVKKIWGCHKVNLGAFGDGLPHMHFHIVPKYVDGFEFGKEFVITNPEPVHLSDEEYTEMTEALKKELGL